MPTPVQAQLTLDTHTPQNVPEFPIHLHILCKHISAFPCAPPLAENFPMTRECTKQLQHHLQWQDGERTTSGLSDHTTKVLCHCKDHAAKGRPSWTDGPSLQWLLLAIKVGGKREWFALLSSSVSCRVMLTTGAMSELYFSCLISHTVLWSSFLYNKMLNQFV